MAIDPQAGGKTGEQTPVPPAVTFIILGFNQTAFIDQAIDAAFAQDYPNLQVVLSDDGSSDGTFAVMQRRVADYRGPHRVRAVRTSRNFGLVNHLLSALAVADGDLIVVAAGDDVSLPHRVGTLAAHWVAHRPAVLYSAFDLMDFEGCFLRRDHSAHTRIFDSADYFLDRDVTIAFGCAAAYSGDFLRSVPLPDQPIWAEDYYLSLIALLRGETIDYIDEPLVSYRQNPQALRNFTAVGVDFTAYERREMRFFDGLLVLTRAFAVIVDGDPAAARTRIRRDRIARDIAWYCYRSDWADRSFLGRLGYTLTLRSRQRLRWALPRLIGLPGFIAVKTLAAKVRGRQAGTPG